MTPSPLRAPASGNDDLPISIDDAINPHVRSGVDYWQSVRGQRRFPARTDLTLRGMAAILPFAVILSVIENGADYEYRYVGDVQRQAFGIHFKGMRLTQIEAAVPELGRVLRSVYDQVRSLGKPFVMRGRVDRETAEAKFLYHETAFLPLGVGEAAVDHLLIVGAQVPTPFWNIATDDLKVLAAQVRP